MIMDIKDFANYTKSLKKELDELMRRQMPITAGRMAKNHFQDNFRKGGFVNGGFHPWPKTIRQSSGGVDAYSNNGPLLSGNNHLFESIKYEPGDYRVRVSNELLYAPYHNWGADITVTERMRKYAWHRYYEEIGGTPKAKGKEKTKGGEKTSRNSFWKNLALTKKTKLHIPQRQFLGESREIREQIEQRTEEEIRKIINS